MPPAPSSMRAAWPTWTLSSATARREPRSAARACGPRTSRATAAPPPYFSPARLRWSPGWTSAARGTPAAPAARSAIMPTSDTATRRHGDAAIRFERTTDYDLVRAILTHPQLYPRMGDDATPP